jgi:hypothetical protein
MGWLSLKRDDGLWAAGWRLFGLEEEGPEGWGFPFC